MDALRNQTAWPGLFPKSHILWQLYQQCEISPPGNGTAGQKPPPITRVKMGQKKDGSARGKKQPRTAAFWYSLV